jgi:hypothetical protein
MITTEPRAVPLRLSVQRHRTMGVHLVGPRFRMIPAVRPFSTL